MVVLLPQAVTTSAAAIPRTSGPNRVVRSLLSPCNIDFSFVGVSPGKFHIPGSGWIRNCDHVRAERLGASSAVHELFMRRAVSIAPEGGYCERNANHPVPPVVDARPLRAVAAAAMLAVSSSLAPGARQTLTGRDTVV